MRVHEDRLLNPAVPPEVQALLGPREPGPMCYECMGEIRAGEVMRAVRYEPDEIPAGYEIKQPGRPVKCWAHERCVEDPDAGE